MISISAIADQVGRALLHSVWQGAVLAIIFGAMLLALRKRSAQSRYVVGCVTLLLMVIAPIATVALRPATPILRSETVLNVPVQATPVPQATPPLNRPQAVAPVHHAALSMLQIATIVWAAGLFVVCLWQISGWLTVRKLVRRSHPADADQIDLLERLRDRVGISFVVALRICEHLTTPSLIGWVRPVILIPPAALGALPIDYLESLLLHELAHIRRRDYLVNLLQTAAETLLFYHPAAWWVSRVIRDEREHCCDDDVVRVMDTKTYVRALAFMEAQRADDVGRLALSAADGKLLRRIQRLTGIASRRQSGAGVLMILGLLGVIIIASACYAAKRTETPQTKPTSHPTIDVKGPSRGVIPEDLAFIFNGAYHIQRGDKLAVSVGDLSGPSTTDTRSSVVSATGEIRLDLISDALKVVGMTEAEAEQAVIDSYKTHGLIERARVNVVVSERQRQVFTVVGAVAHAGQFNLTDSHLRVLNAIAIAGGTIGNDVSRIVALRESDDRDASIAIEIPADRLMAGDPSVNIAIRPMDTIIVTAGTAAIVQPQELDAVTPTQPSDAAAQPPAPKLNPEELALTDGLLAGYLEKLRILKNERDDVKRQGYGNKNTRMVQIDADIKNLEQSIQLRAALLSRLAPPPAQLIANGKPANVGDYHLVPNDLIQIQIANLTGPNTETVKQARVTEKGGISLPGLLTAIRVVGLSEVQVEAAISKAYQEAQVLDRPTISVTVIEAHGQKQVAPVPPVVALADEDSGPLNTPPTIGPNDLIEVVLQLKNKPDLLQQSRVDMAGKVRVPILPERFQVDGLTDKDAAAGIRKAYQDTGHDEVTGVTVNGIERRRFVYTVGGYVNQAGQYRLEHDSTLSSAIKQANGVKPNATNIVVLKRKWPFGTPERELKLDVVSALAGDQASNLYLRPGDVIIVGAK